MAKFTIYHQGSDRWWLNKNEERVAYMDPNGDLLINNFLVNGSSCGLLASIHGLFKADDTVLVQRNAHKSIYNGLMLLGIETKYLMPERMEPESIAGVVTPTILRSSIDENPDAKGVIITSPTYYGHTADIKKLAEICHYHNLLLLVDEAHGAHYYFHPELKKHSAIYQGADVVVQSIHKTLPAMTMGSMLHISHEAQERIDRVRLAYYLSVFQTTSPSYIVMASLDYARHWVLKYGQALIEQAFHRKHSLIDSLEKIGIKVWDRVWERQGKVGDPLKLTMSLETLGMTGKKLEQILADKLIFIELVSVDHIVLLLHLEESQSTDKRLLRVITKHIQEKQVSQIKRKELKLPLEKPKIAVSFSMISREIIEKSTTSYATEQCSGKVAAEFIIPYPPGVPILCPGERITDDHVRFIIEAKDNGIHFQGMASKDCDRIKCFTGR